MNSFRKSRMVFIAAPSFGIPTGFIVGDHFFKSGHIPLGGVVMMVTMLGWVGLAWVYFFVARQRAKKARWELCLECEYPLEGLPLDGHCPECGEAYSRDLVAGIWQRRWTNKNEYPMSRGEKICAGFLWGFSVLILAAWYTR